MMRVVVLKAEVHRRIIDELTTPTERLIYPDRCKRLADGSVQWNMPDDAAAALQEFMLQGESYADAIERLLAVAGGRIS